MLVPKMQLSAVRASRPSSIFHGASEIPGSNTLRNIVASRAVEAPHLPCTGVDIVMHSMYAPHEHSLDDGVRRNRHLLALGTLLDDARGGIILIVLKAASRNLVET